MRARRDEDPAEVRRPDDLPVRGAVEPAPAGEDQVLQAGPLVQPGDELQQRVLPHLLPRSGEVRARLEARRVAGPAVGLAVGEDLDPLLGDEDLVPADLQCRQPHRRRVAERRQAHDLALVALPLGPQHLRQQGVEAAEADRALPVAVPQLLGEALDPPAALAPVEGAHLEELLRRARRQVRAVREVLDPAALVVDDEAGGDVERRGVEGAVQVRDVMADLDDAGVGGEFQGGAQLGVVLLDPVQLRVARPALDDEVDRLVQPGQPPEVELRQVAEPAPVVLAAAEALLLEAVHRRPAAGHRDRAVLRPVDPDDRRHVRSSGLLRWVRA